MHLIVSARFSLDILSSLKFAHRIRPGVHVMANQPVAQNNVPNAAVAQVGFFDDRAACWFYLTGGPCPYEPHCRFRHDLCHTLLETGHNCDDVALCRRAHFRLELCRFWATGRRCPHQGDCSYSHGYDDDRGVPHVYRVSLCTRFFSSSGCRFGSRCWFRHIRTEAEAEMDVD
ncbi:hypothetical protein TSUD_384530 [Trifolium subterraneum]|uniref:C3H1-type domain-containing protein n=1 Tax=Trifolium subterraneum TaxID=3900 RepID=A0A2Z6NS17_TRISU|nr:hypothetical protein TSUD_384530 [Trifolium subterraneum]